MPKKPDKSEQVRIRRESEKLGLSFLETLYYMVGCYRQNSLIRTNTPPAWSSEPQPKPLFERNELSDDEIDLNLEDFA